MALFPKTPGVYIQEISTLPPSVAPVPTSIPVFVGYTEQAIVDGNPLASFPTYPIHIESMIQFQEIFGGPNTETFLASLSGTAVNIAVSRTTTTPDFRLFYNMQMYFANGGGPCYVISVKEYSTASSIDKIELTAAINKAEQVDEITMVVIPDAISISSNADRSVVYNGMLAHCAKMQDRFSLLDVITDTTQTIALDAKDFRDDAVGANNLSYGASYYPSFTPLFPFAYTDGNITVDASASNLPANVIAFGVTTLDVINNGIKTSVAVTITGNITPNAFSIGGINLGTSAVATSFTGATLATAINSNPALSSKFIASATGASTLTITAVTAGTPTAIAIVGAGATSVAGPIGIAPDKVLYNRIKSAIDGFALELYPSATMAGVYCAVDTARGVWKAPANVGVNLVGTLNRNIKDADQSDLNVDATSGKSIDVLRKFDGRGILVWGARTLDGNSNEWRYVNVRRTFLFIEDSCKKASEFVVFEPNDKNTWIRVKGTISSFLSGLWRDGALAGDKPEQAYFVKIGLGETMTSQDILEGRLIVQIGLAVVRPAEFIILQFEHKLQEA
jgi:phage tail sheath protein FI